MKESPGQVRLLTAAAALSTALPKGSKDYAQHT